MNKSEKKGARYIRIDTFAIVMEYFSAFNQSKNVIPISNNPIYKVPINAIKEIPGEL